MATQRDTVAQLYTSIYDEFLLGTYNDYESACMKVVTEVSTNQKDYLVDDISGLSMWESIGELEEANAEDPVLGYPKTYTIGKFNKLFQVSFEATDDDEYALMKKQGEAMNMGKGCLAKKAYDLAQVLYTGFSVAGPDGQFLFDSDHPKNREETGVTYDNLLSGAFSHDTLEDAEKQITDNMYDQKGLPIPITQDPCLLFAPKNRGIVQRVFNERATERPGTANRDINQFNGRKGYFTYRIEEDVWLNTANGANDDAWYIIFPWMKYYKIIWRQKPTFVSWVDYDIDAYNFKGVTRYAVGYDNWRLGFASTGS